MPTILIVDDDVGFAQGLAECLRLRGYHTLLEYNGDTALGVMAGRSVDVVLCDIVMPGLLGPGFLQKAHSVPGQDTLPVVFMSSLPEERVSRMFDGYAAYMRKPFAVPDLVRTIEQVIAPPRRSTPVKKRVRDDFPPSLETRGRDDFPPSRI